MFNLLALIRISFLFSAVAGINFVPVDEKNTTPTSPDNNNTSLLTRAASSFVNCGCQCSSLTFRDESGKIHGNCKSVDDKGAQWCYISSTHYSSCEDLQASTKFPNNPWSYSACATPDISSYECTSLSSTPLDNTVYTVTGYTGTTCKCPECGKPGTRPLTIADIITGKNNMEYENDDNDNIVFRK